jgi:pimeloyl-ACP methyl ester carboxylesterase
MAKTLIIYVHGALSTRNSWNYIRQKLSDKLDGVEEKPAEEFIKYNLNHELSAEIVEKMVEKITSLIDKQGFNKLVLIGHSFGGVLSVAAVRELMDYLTEKKIKPKIITLSAPFGGSEIAAVLRIMKPGSMFFKNVGHHGEFVQAFRKLKLPCKTHAFITTEGGADWMPQANDGVVTVSSQLFFENDPLITIQEAKVNHFEILLSDLVVTQLLKEAK